MIHNSSLIIHPSLRALLLILVLVPCGPVRAEGDVRMVRVRGDAVTVRLHGAEGVQPAVVGLGLEPGDEVRTGAESQAEILFSAQNVLSVRENSVIRLPLPGEAPAADIRMGVGTLLFKLKHVSRAPFYVRTPNAVAAVRGTEFAVEIPAAGEATLIGVFDEGRVAAATEAGEVELGPGQETACAAGSPPEAPRPLTALRKYRAAMRALRGRLAALQREYRRLPREKLRELRRRRKDRE